MKRGYEIKEYSIAEIAYFAGLIDGEGSIYIGNFSNNKITGAKYFQTNMQITNTCEKMIDWLIDVFGGLKSKRTPRQHALNSRLQAYVWTVSGKRLEHLCEIILPYTVSKKRQVEIMLEMRKTYTKTGSGRAEKGKQGIQPNSPEILSKRDSLMKQMKSLHIRTFSHKNH